MSDANRTSRRAFLGTAAAASALALPLFVPRAVLGGPGFTAPSDRVNVGFVGVANQGTQNLRALMRHAVAVCDVDAKHLGEAQAKADKAGRPCQAYDDYRRLLDDKNVDAVVVTTPDHWHALIAIDACQAGKDVYCEKPLTLTIAEGQAMVAAARANKRIVQTGSQQRSDAKFRQACELVRSGRIGKVHTVRAGISGVNFRGERAADCDPPSELNYDFWLGPAPLRPYNPRRVHYNFRFFWDYSGGQLTNWGAHNLDIAQWGLGMDESGPVSIEGKARYEPTGLYDVPQWCEVVYKYADGTTVLCGQDQPGGTTFEGERGTIHVDRKRLTAEPAALLQQPLSAGDVRLYESNDHYANWLDCIKTRELPICDVAIGHRSATVCHLGNIAIRTGRRISWDPAAEAIVGDDAAQAMLARPYRAPWSLPDA